MIITVIMTSKAKTWQKDGNMNLLCCLNSTNFLRIKSFLINVVDLKVSIYFKKIPFLKISTVNLHNLREGKVVKWFATSAVSQNVTLIGVTCSHTSCARVDGRLGGWGRGWVGVRGSVGYTGNAM